MTQDPYNAPTVPPARPRGRNTALIIVIVILVLCCVLAVVLGVLWQFGDAILQALGITL